ncbi:MAG: RagB/SusD family nutrient uptake outer membrane protein [Janthinobacterium lividum]
MTIQKLLTSGGLLALLATAGLGTSSCKKDFIDLNDPTRQASSLGYTDSLSIVTGVTAAYASLQDMYGKSGTTRGMFVFGEIPSDNSYTVSSGERFNEFDNFTLLSDNPKLQAQWVAMYQTIARCNIILNRADAIKLTAATRNRFYGEVRFIRALAYFNAVRIWGDIPLVTTEITNIADAYTFGRKPAADVYKLIEDDLTFAETNLPATQTTANLGRATKGAAQGLLGKVYLTEKKYSDAAAKLKQVIDANNYALQATYGNIFLTTNEMNSEILFAVRYSKGGLGVGSPFTVWFMPAYTTAQSTALLGVAYTGQQFNTVDVDLVNAFTASGTTDVRAATSYVQPTGATSYYTRKYIDAPTTSTDAENDWIVLRYADVLLMYAEAINEGTGPDALSLDATNRVIRRSRGLAVATAAPTVDLPATTSQADLRTRLETERRLELNFEGHRWFDLVRTNRAIPVMNAFFTKNNSATRIDAHNLVFPVPIQEIQTNPILTQNPGYL